MTTPHQFITLLFTANIEWIVRNPNDPLSPPISSLDGCQIVSPARARPPSGSALGILPARESGSLFVSTNFLTVVVRPGLSEEISDWERRLGNQVEALLAKARVATGQTAITEARLAATVRPPAHAPGISESIDELLELDHAELVGRVSYMPNVLGRAIPFDQLDRIEEIDSSDHYVARGTLVDAFAAADQGDPRRSIIYAAIAMDAISTTVLHAAAELLAGDAAFRWTTLQLSGGRTQSYDPVARALLRESDQFAARLHEVPLYILRKSLQLEDPILYRDAVATYTTRNKLVHLGAVPVGDNKTIPVDATGSRLALDVACRVFKWFGADLPTGVLSRDS